MIGFSEDENRETEKTKLKMKKMMERRVTGARKPIFVSHVYAFMVYLLGLDNPTESFLFSVSDYDEKALRLKQVISCTRYFFFFFWLSE